MCLIRVAMRHAADNVRRREAQHARGSRGLHSGGLTFSNTQLNCFSMKKQKSGSKKIATPYASFGELLGDLRRKAGIGHQSDLAVLVGTKQQTVNRWEAGLSRPRDKEISKLRSEER